MICTILAGAGSADWDLVEDTWNLHRYAALVRHWSREGPPAYVAVAAYLGLRQPRQPAADRVEGDDLMRLLGAFPGGERS